MPNFFLLISKKQTQKLFLENFSVNKTYFFSHFLLFIFNWAKSRFYSLTKCHNIFRGFFSLRLLNFLLSPRFIMAKFELCESDIQFLKKDFYFLSLLIHETFFISIFWLFIFFCLSTDFRFFSWIESVFCCGTDLLLKNLVILRCSSRNFWNFLVSVSVINSEFWKEAENFVVNRMIRLLSECNGKVQWLW